MPRVSPTNKNTTKRNGRNKNKKSIKLEEIFCRPSILVSVQKLKKKKNLEQVLFNDFSFSDFPRHGSLMHIKLFQTSPQEGKRKALPYLAVELKKGVCMLFAIIFATVPKY